MQALLGKLVIRDLAGGWKDDEDFQEHTYKRIPALRLIMMTIKRTRDLNHTIHLVSSSDEAEVKTSCVVDLGVPAAQQEGEDGQSKEEQTNSNTHSVQPL